MPVSLTPFRSELHEQIQSSNTVKRGKLKTTKEMLEDALIGLHSAKGTTIQQVYKFIANNNNLYSLSTSRIALIKKHLKLLQETGNVVNKTGKGLVGHFKLVDKAKFITSITKNTKRVKENIKETPPPIHRRVTRRPSNKFIKSITKNTKRVKENIKETPPPIHRRVTRRPSNNKTSIFDTPTSETQLQTSTPLQGASLTPWAPAARKRSNREKLPDVNPETPRTSLPKERRKLRSQSENIY